MKKQTFLFELLTLGLYLGLSLGLNLGVCSPVSAQEPDLGHIADSIMQAGRQLYASEITSWQGTDLFLEKFKDRDKLKGYFSYQDQGTWKCIFFGKQDTSAMVLGCVSFDSTHQPSAARVDFTSRSFSPTEAAYYSLRSKALEVILHDTLFKFYKNTELNLIPVISDGERSVIVLTGTNQQGKIIFGNDYELLFDANNGLRERRKLHRNIIFTEFGGEQADGKVIKVTTHTHAAETGDFITATDVCTLLLYGKLSRLEQHYVISKGYLSIWDCQKERLIIMTQEALKRISEEEQKSH